MSEAEWLQQWEEQHLSSHSDESGEVANMNRTDYATMLAQLEGR